MSKFRDFLGKANRLQQRRSFKIVATCVVAVLAIAAAVAYTVRVSQAEVVELPDAVASDVMDVPEGDLAAKAEANKAAEAQLEAENKARDIYRKILAGRQDPTSASVGIAIGAALIITVIWLGLALTYLALAAGAGVLVGGVELLGRVVELPESLVPLIVGIAALTASFTALLRVVRILLGGASPTFAVARNVLDEAVRMRISMVFIVLLIFGLAALPGWLDQEAFLRYRIQSFMQYATGGAFWLIAVLVLTFSVSSVTFEQRDKVIWQTMTKPVRAWQYVLGKWLGVVTLAAVLLGVSASGIFLFTEYLRNQPANGENSAYRTPEGGGYLSEDRFIIETQVLAARESVQPNPAEIDEEQLRANVEAFVDSEMQRMSEGGERSEWLNSKREEIRARYFKDLPQSVELAFRTIAPGQNRRYTFSGLDGVRDSSSPLLLRLKVNAGGNMPDQLYKITILASDGSRRDLEAPLNQIISVRPPILPTAVDPEGKFEIEIYNGQLMGNQLIPNAESISFPPDGMELSYARGSYRVNFFRCMSVLWVKLAFLAMIGVCAGTFLSFPVACLVAFAVFFAAEGASSVLTAVDYYRTEDQQGNMLWFPTLVAKVATWVSRPFKVYSDLDPPKRLVEGLRLSWAQMATGIVVLTTATSAMFVVAVLIFRRRELATYSGH